MDRAVLIAAFFRFVLREESTKLKAIEKGFRDADLAAPNVTVLNRMLSSDRRVSTKSDSVRALKLAKRFFEERFPEVLVNEKGSAAIPMEMRERLETTPFIDSDYVRDLEKMVSFYAALHTLENSMRRLIAAVLESKFGPEWWQEAANISQKKKHSDRLDKEQRRQWLPARSSLGPLYSLDWSDLIGIMRRYESDFVPFVGEIDFLHRFADLGLLRHVVAHNGFIDDQTQLQRVSLALHDWQKQVGSTTFGLSETS